MASTRSSNILANYFAPLKIIMNELDIAFKLNDQIITFWQFYVAGTTGIVGWVFSREKAWPKQKRIAVGVTAIIFIIFSFVALYKTISNLTKIVELLSDKAFELASTGINEAVFKFALERLDQGGLLLNLGPHILVDCIVLYFIFILSKTDPSANK